MSRSIFWSGFSLSETPTVIKGEKNGPQWEAVRYDGARGFIVRPKAAYWRVRA